jgi:hypothetical protein
MEEFRTATENTRCGVVDDTQQQINQDLRERLARLEALFATLRPAAGR